MNKDCIYLILYQSYILKEFYSESIDTKLAKELAFKEYKLMSI